MKLRSMLFVPADSEKKLLKSRESLADALIFDLEDSVAQARKPHGRQMCVEHLQNTRDTDRSWKAFVRINPLDSIYALDDLAAVVVPGLDGIVLPKNNSVQDIATLSHYLDVLEVRAGLPRGHIRIVVVATETARAMLAMDGYHQASARLAAVTWGAEDLSTDVGAASNREDDGSFSHVYLMARSFCLLAAAAAQVAALDTLYVDFRNPDGLEQDCHASRKRGFTGRIAIHPDQVEIIHKCYTPGQAEIEMARAIIQAFSTNPDLGTVGIDGKMYDRPHLVQAQRILAAAGLN